MGSKRELIAPKGDKRMRAVASRKAMMSVVRLPKTGARKPRRLLNLVRGIGATGSGRYRSQPSLPCTFTISSGHLPTGRRGA